MGTPYRYDIVGTPYCYDIVGTPYRYDIVGTPYRYDIVGTPYRYDIVGTPYHYDIVGTPYRYDFASKRTSRMFDECLCSNLFVYLLNDGSVIKMLPVIFLVYRNLHNYHNNIQ